MDTELTTTTNAALEPATYAPDRNPALVYLAGLRSEHSRRAMRQSLNAIAHLLTDGQLDGLALPWHTLRYQHTQAIRAKLADAYSAATANRHLAALRGVLKEAWRLGHMSAEDYQRAIDIKPLKGVKAAQAERGRHLTPGELTALLGACADGTTAGARDAAIIAIGYTAGLRRSELAGLWLTDFDPNNNALTIRAGKGNKERVVYLANGTLEALGDWLHVRGPWVGPLFTRIRQGDRIEYGGLTAQAIYTIMASRAEAAGVKSFSPHDLRRTFAGDMLDAGVDIATVQQLMGHASVSTTAGYDRRDAKAKKAAAGKLHVAYRRQFGR